MDLESYLEAWRRASRVETPLVVARRLGSTQILARRLAEARLAAGAAPRIAVVALEQTAGRGRRGRRWSSPAGRGIYLTVAMPVAGAGTLAAIPLAVPAAVCAELEPWLAEPCRIKWPNDLLIGGRKLGGILVEVLSGGGGTPCAALVGVGLNHGRTADSSAMDPDLAGAIGLAEVATRLPPIEELTVALALAIESALDPPPALDRAVERYRERLVHRGGETIRCRLGARLVEGAFEGLDERGRLILATSSGREVLSAGDLVEPEPGE